jgi:hypothetical protein
VEGNSDSNSGSFIRDAYNARFSVQVASYIQKKNALELKTKLQKNFDHVYIVQYKKGPEIFYRIRINASSKESARALSQKIEEMGYKPIVFINSSPSN